MLDFYASNFYREFYDPPGTNYEALYQPTNFIAEVCAKYINPDSYVIEIGAAGGWNLVPFPRHFGVELSEKMRELGRSHNIYMDKEAPDHQFDLLISCHVIEHTFDPRAELKRWKELAPLIYLECPDIDHMRADQFVNVHNWYFTTRTLSRLCNDVGLIPKTAGARRHHQYMVLERA